MSSEEKLLSMLVKIVNRAGRARPTSTENVTVADVPVELLKQARNLLEEYRDCELSTAELRHATNRVWG